MKRALITLWAATAVAAILPATGSGALPKSKDKLIDVPISIGGVVLREKIKNADKAWGRSGECTTAPGFRSCAYEGKSEETGVAKIEAAVHKQVSAFEIEAGRNDESEYVFEGRLLKFETKEGIGLGDSGKRIAKLYPDAIKTAKNTGYLITGKGKSYMTIQTLDGKHITAITVVDGVHQG